MIYSSASRYLSQYPFLKRVMKFLIVGGSSAVINFAIYFSLTEWFNIWYVISAILSFIVAAIFNFCINKFWTFRSLNRGRDAYGEIVKFLVVYVSGLVINTALIYFFKEAGGLDYRLSWVVATGIVTFWNFGLSQFWTFRA